LAGELIINKKEMEGEGEMKKEIKGMVMILLLIAAVTVVPLTARAEMQVMSNSELEMTTAQMTIGDAFGGFMNVMLPMVNKLIGQKNSVALGKVVVGILSPLSPLVDSFNPTMNKIMAYEIPCTK